MARKAAGLNPKPSIRFPKLIWFRRIVSLRDDQMVIFSKNVSMVSSKSKQILKYYSALLLKIISENYLMFVEFLTI